MSSNELKMSGNEERLKNKGKPRPAKASSGNGLTEKSLAGDPLDAAREEAIKIALTTPTNNVDRTEAPFPRNVMEENLKRRNNKNNCRRTRRQRASSPVTSASETGGNFHEPSNPDFVEVSTDFIAATKQAAVNIALSGTRVDDEKSKYRDFRVSDPSATDPALVEDIEASPPTNSTPLSPRAGAYHRRPGEGEERRNTFRPDQLKVQHIGLQTTTNTATQDKDFHSSVTTPFGENNIMTSTSNLVEAKPVSERFGASTLNITAEPADLAAIEENESKKRQFNRKLFLGLPLLLVLVVGVILAMVFGLRESTDYSTTTQFTVSPSPTITPTMAPTTPLIIELPPATVEKILTVDESPQAKAYRWLANDPNRGNFSAKRLLQRFVLATFYYSLDGDNWYLNGKTFSSRSTTSESRQGPPTNGFGGGGPPPNSTSLTPPNSKPPQQYQWLSYNDTVHECDWYNMNHAGKGKRKQTCNDLDEYIHLEMPGNNLYGSLPPELALLASMESLVLHRNEIAGTLPKQLFTSWAKLNEIMLAENKLSGRIPSQVGLWAENIRLLSLQTNSFTGSLPSELWQLTNLQMLHLHENSWTNGCISTDIGNLKQLGSLEFNSNCFNSSLPTEIGKATSLFRLQFTSAIAWTIPSQLARLPNLAYVMFEGANLMGTIPKEFENLSNLVLLNVNKNPQLVGSIPASLGSLVSPALNQTPGCPPKQPHIPPRPPREQNLDLKMVFLKGAGLTGTIPPEWCNSLEILCFDDCSNSSKLCGCGCPCPT